MISNNLVDEYITKSTDKQYEILSKLRRIISNTFQEVKENFKWNRPVYCITKDFCYLQKNKNYINIGFMNIENIKDEKKLLEGTGKTMRHLKIYNSEDIDEKYLIRLLRQAAN